MPTPLLKGIRPPGNSFVLPEHKIVYISVTKVACTSLRWMLADLAGEDLASFYDAKPAHQTRLMTIHRDRTHWKKTPQLASLPAGVLESISPDNGWFVFVVVRDPWSRLFAAWQSKFLVRHAAYVRAYGDEPWFPQVPSSPEGVVTDWRNFVEAAPWRTHELLKKDRHFLPQVVSVQPTKINYSRIYDLRRLGELFDDLHAHLKIVGRDQELYLPRANETPLTPTADCFADGLAEQIQQLYKADFDAFPDRWRIEDVKVAERPWSMDAIRHAAFHTVANERIGDLSEVALAQQQQLREADRRIAQLTRLATPSGQARNLVREYAPRPLLEAVRKQRGKRRDA